VPRLWNDTIETHRAAVREATLDTTAALVAEHGLRSVTMSQIAQETGIARATLYKYFSDVEAILLAWHERQITGHLEQLGQRRAHVVERPLHERTVKEQTFEHKNIRSAIRSVVEDVPHQAEGRGTE